MPEVDRIELEQLIDSISADYKARILKKYEAEAKLSRAERLFCSAAVNGETKQEREIFYALWRKAVRAYVDVVNN